MEVVKPKDRKDDLHIFSLSLSHLRKLLLSHSCALVSECVCDKHSLFIFFRSLNVHSNMSASLNDYLLGPTSLGESNNPSAPQLWGLFPPINKKG